MSTRIILQAMLDIALDTACNPHISYLDKNLGLKYATNESGYWSYEVIDTSYNVGWNTSIAFDGNNHAHISFSDPSPLIDSTGNGFLKYASDATGTWSIFIVDSANAGMYTCIAIDTNNIPHFSYTAIDPFFGSGILKHAFQSVPTDFGEEADLDFEPSVYPNPSADFIYIGLPGSFQYTEILFYDVKGSMYKRFPAVNDKNLIDISDLPAGLYLIRIISGIEPLKPLRFIRF